VRFPAFITTNTLLPVFATQTFFLDQLADYKSYISVFDEYKIVAIEAMVSPLVDVQPIAGQSDGLLASVIDTDDATPFTSFADAGNYSNCVTSKGSYVHMRSFRPKFSRAIFSSALVTGYGSASGWLDCASPSVPHYGLKVAWTVTSQPIQADLVVRYSVMFRHTV